MKKNTSRLFFEILDAKRRDSFALLKRLCPTGVLGGGTAMALHLKHRESLDLDVFTEKSIPKNLLRKLAAAFGEKRVRPLVDTADELSAVVDDDIKITFLYFPFPPLHPIIPTHGIPLFSLADLASNKAYAIGRRGVFRDYVDLYFLMQNDTLLENIIPECEQRFGANFDRKLFLEQLVYFGDFTDFNVKYLGKEASPEEIKRFFEKKTREYIASS